MVTFADDFRNACPDDFNTAYIEPPFQTKEEKAERLGLSQDRIRELKSIKVKSFNGNINDYVVSKREHINVNNIIGYGMHNPETWYDALDFTVCHKPVSFIMYNKDTFPVYIDCEDNDDLPSVIEVDGKYFIYGGGTHRLTIAKCTGCDKAYVDVYCKKVE